MAKMDFCISHMYVLFVFLFVPKGLYGYQDEAGQNIYVGM